MAAKRAPSVKILKTVALKHNVMNNFRIILFYSYDKLKKKSMFFIYK